MSKTTSLLLAAAALMLTLSSQSAQENPPPQNPDFKDAPVSDVLKWAQAELGCGFIYEGQDLFEGGKPLSISSASLKPGNKAERTLALFELLRRVGLVAFQVEGLPGPVYQIVKGPQAARFATVARTPQEAARYYFAALAIKLSRASPQAVATAMKEKLTPGVGSIEVFEATHTLVVCDFSDRLLAAHALAQAADTPALRDDDLVVADFVPRSLPAKRLSAAVERLRARGETWQSSVNEHSNLLLISGRRDEVARVSERMSRLDSKPQDPAFAETVETFKVSNGSAEEAARTLKQMFELEIASGSVQVGAFERARKIVFRGSRADVLRAQEALKQVDVAPDGAPKDK
ncbi:MAG: hypothetical protein HUU03_08080 [Planctomycetaceae bacterium]|nr:hypothetical protein [Planctomycetaceae bacterium]